MDPMSPLKQIEQVQKFGLDMITLPSHTSNALHPLDVACSSLSRLLLERK
jgi:hypothetical protein